MKRVYVVLAGDLIYIYDYRHTYYQYSYLDLLGCVDLLTAVDITYLRDVAKDY